MIDTNKASAQKFLQIKDQIRQKAGSGEQVKVAGDNYEVVETFQVSSPDGDYSVLKGSRFDNDLKTRDKISVRMEPNGDVVKETRDYEHYGKKGWIFTDERLSVTFQQEKRIEGGFTSLGGSSDFSL